MLTCVEVTRGGDDDTSTFRATLRNPRVCEDISRINRANSLCHRRLSLEEHVVTRRIVIVQTDGMFVRHVGEVCRILVQAVQHPKIFKRREEKDG